jgi:hypothetical protein
MGILSKLNKKDSYTEFTIYRLTSGVKVLLQLNVDIFGLDSSLKGLLSAPFYKMFWNDVKEKFGKDVDEKELYKVFKFLVFIGLLTSILEDATKDISPLNIINDT